MSNEGRHGLRIVVSGKPVVVFEVPFCRAESLIRLVCFRDSKSQNEAYWLLSAALRGLRGPLIPALRRGEYRPLDLCGHEIHLLSNFRSHRFFFRRF